MTRAPHNRHPSSTVISSFYLLYEQFGSINAGYPCRAYFRNLESSGSRDVNSRMCDAVTRDEFSRSISNTVSSRGDVEMS